MEEQTFKDALLKKRTEILGTGGIKPLQASMDNNTRQGDMADQASGNNEVHIALKLKQTDAKILQAIEEALWRIEKGTYGMCRDCGGTDRTGTAQRDSMDPRLHYLQGKAELVTDLLPLLQEFYKEKLTMLLQHQAGARLIGQYDANNTYQYIINREDAQLSWVATAISELGGTVEDMSEPVRSPKGKAAAAAQAIFEEDLQDAQRFVDRWRPRIDEMNNARHAKMLRVILGETLEQKRFFEQALAGRHDLLGRRAEQIVGPAIGEVLPSRWIE